MKTYDLESGNALLYLSSSARSMCPLMLLGITWLIYSCIFDLFYSLFFSSEPLFISVAVVVAFFCCWAPFHAQRLMAIHVNEPTPAEEVVFTILTHISGISYYLSATINPILYSIMSLKFRQAFKDTLGRCCGRRSCSTNTQLDERTSTNKKSQV